MSSESSKPPESVGRILVVSFGVGSCPVPDPMARHLAAAFVAALLCWIAPASLEAALYSSAPTSEETPQNAVHSPEDFNDSERPTTIDPATQIEVGGVLVREADAVSEKIRYMVTYVYGHDIWANRLSFDGSRQEKTSIRFSRWELDGTWAYLSPDPQRRPALRLHEKKRGSRRGGSEPTMRSVVSKNPGGLYVQSGSVLYVGGTRTHTVHAIDLTTGQKEAGKLNRGVFQNEVVLKGPVAMLQIGNLLYVAGSQSNTVVAIDMSSGQVQQVVHGGKEFERPSALVQVGNQVYVAGSQSNSVVAIDLSSGDSKVVYKEEGVLRRPSAMVCIKNILYVAGFQSNTVVAVDVDGQTVKSVLKDESLLRGPMAMFQANRQLYVAGSQSNSVVAIDLSEDSSVPASEMVSVPLADIEPLLAQAQMKSIPPVQLSDAAQEQGIVVYTPAEALQRYPEIHERVSAKTELVLVLPKNYSAQTQAALEILRKRAADWIGRPVLEVLDIFRLKDESIALLIQPAL